LTIIILKNIKTINIQECNNISTLDFHTCVRGIIPKLEINIVGNINIKSISNWHLSSLNMIHNNITKYISFLHQIDNLILDCCNNILCVKNIFINNKLHINGCQSIKYINSILGLEELELYNCGNLVDITIKSSQIKNIKLLECLSIINCRLNAVNMDSVYIQNTGLIILDNLTFETKLNITGMKYLFDEPITDTYEYISYISHIVMSINIIFRSIDRYKRKKYLNNVSVYNKNIICNICLDGDNNNEYQITPCFHRFHKSCLLKWISFKHTCPICCNPYI
jgi:hypothetical protein